MATIIFGMMPGEKGHLNCSFGLARDLVKRGHQIFYVGLADDRDQVVQQGFQYRVLAAREWPLGTIGRIKNLSARAHRGFWSSLLGSIRLLDEVISQAATFLNRVTPNGLAETFACDFFIGDEAAPWLTALALHHGCSCAQLSTMFPINRRFPPPGSSRLPDVSLLGRLQNRVDWFRADVGALPSRAVLNWILSRHDLTERSVLRRLSIDEEFIWDASKLVLNLPVVHAVPHCLDFVSLDEKEAPISDACVDLDRRERPLEWSAYDEGQVRICTALGGYNQDSDTDFLRRLLQVMETRPRWRMVLSLANDRMQTELGKLPSNVRAFDFIPQLNVLSRSNVMITHCGLNSVKEAILFEIPMVGFPKRRDQPSVAARIEHHELGLIGSLSNSSAPEIASMIEAVIDDPGYRDRVQAMSSLLKTMQSFAPGATAIEHMIAGDLAKPTSMAI